MSQILIIGYGNVLRADDAVGCCAAEQLQQHYRDDPDVEVIASHQLTPEMALDISRSEFVVFLDASSAEEPGKISQTRILPDTAHVGFTHQLTPATLLSLAEQLYGHAPEADRHHAGRLVVQAEKQTLSPRGNTPACIGRPSQGRRGKSPASRTQNRLEWAPG